MAGVVLLYIGAIIVFGWGAAHIAPVKGVVKGFGDITPENRRIITMTWVSEGLGLCFIGVIVFVEALLYGIDSGCARAVYISAAVMLVLGAFWTALTGARTRIVPMKICPIVKIVAAGLFVLGMALR
jgi:hypothetical protein